MSNSSLVTKGFHQAHSGNYTANRAANGGSQKKITLHHFAGNLSLEWLAQLWQTVGREGSSHYGVKDRDIIQCVNESDIAWTDGDWESNKNSITIEVSNSGGAPDWPVSAESLETAAQLCADIAKRNGLGKLVKGQNLTWHQMYASTACPGPHMLASIDAIANRANEINAQGASTPPTSTPAPSGAAKYKVQIGAFGNKANAESLAAKAKANGFETYIAQEGGMYKVQLGAFNDEANAKALGNKAKAAGFEVYIAGLSTSAAAAPWPSLLLPSA